MFVASGLSVRGSQRSSVCIHGLPADDGTLHEPLMVAQEVIDRFVGRGHPDLAEQRESHANHRTRLAHAGQRGKWILLERVRREIDCECGRLGDGGHRFIVEAGMSPEKPGASTEQIPGASLLPAKKETPSP